jgi:chemotaxis protein methyltransferase CheR
MFHPSERDVEISEEAFRLLRDLIHEKLGIYFDEGHKASLRSRLAGRLNHLDLLSFEDYYHYLRFGPQRDEELHHMVSHITNNETYFFREQAQLQVFAEHVLKQLKSRKSQEGTKSLRILSAGCSTGEEVMTLAMIVYDSGQFFWGWDVEIVGMDVDRAALEKATRGVYYHNSFRSADQALYERHMVRNGTGSEVKGAVRRVARFVPGNITDPASYAGLAPLDVILCRNVLIYFSEAMIRRTVGIFHDVLAPGGYLLLGHAESLSRITDAYTPIRFPGAMIYQKKGAEAA